MSGLLLAECEALSGDIESARDTLDLHASSLDTAEENVYCLHAAAVIAIMAEQKPEASIAALEKAAQAHMDSLQVCPSAVVSERVPYSQRQSLSNQAVWLLHRGKAQSLAL